MISDDLLVLSQYLVYQKKIQNSVYILGLILTANNNLVEVIIKKEYFKNLLWMVKNDMKTFHECCWILDYFL